MKPVLGAATDPQQSIDKIRAFWSMSTKYLGVPRELYFVFYPGCWYEVLFFSCPDEQNHGNRRFLEGDFPPSSIDVRQYQVAPDFEDQNKIKKKQV